jgi:gliding motility-associated-like protein
MAKRFIILILVTLASSNHSFATHNRAGEITYRQLSALTYEFTVTTFTYSLSPADRPELNVEWGDNTFSVAARKDVFSLPNFYRKNVYVVNHTFPGPGVYTIVVQDPNRNAGVQNIPNSVNVVFSIRTILIVNAAFGLNSTPLLLNPPYDKAAKGYIFIHNPAAFDPDGDSLSYKLTTCTRENGKPISNYILPPATNKFYVDSISGDLVWDTPADTGKYNVAMEIQEWRNGKKISMVVRDMQIEVYETNNKPPVNGPLKNFCIEAGDSVILDITSTDPNGDAIFLKATSGVFEIDKCRATFIKLDSVTGLARKRFKWKTCYENVRNQPWDIVVKSEDNNSDLKLFDIDKFQVKVIGPSPLLTNTVPEGKFVKLSWQNYGTTAISGFSIYRREGPSGFTPDSCTVGIPAFTGFKKIGYVPGSNSVSFTDTDNGLGLQFGIEYSYRIVAVFPNGTESKVSNEISTILVSGVPLIKNVSIRNTDEVNGSVFISWRKPTRLDTIPANGPYQYIISRADGISGSSYTQVKSISTATLNDTVYIDTLLNTAARGYLYRIELFNDAPGNRFLIGEPSFASSVFLAVSPGDRKARLSLSRNVPWINSRYDILRYNETTLKYDSIGNTATLSYTDTGIDNGTMYKYLVRSTGAYQKAGLPKDLLNFSQKASVTPVDNEPPCQPTLKVASQCDSLYNKLTWLISDPLCLADIDGYKIYYKPSNAEDLTLLETVTDRNQFTYKHFPGDVISGCYAVSAYDSKGNESLKSVTTCIDSCNFYEIPNVFTPNGDDINDRLVARTSGLVETVDFRLFNRGGLLLFRTSDPKLNWDGTYKGKIVSPGVYFYQCDVTENRISGPETFHLSGFIHVITEKGAKIKREEFK